MPLSASIEATGGLDVVLSWGGAAAGSIDVEWGDETSNTLASTGGAFGRTYTEAGTYSVTVTDGVDTVDLSVAVPPSSGEFHHMIGRAEIEAVQTEQWPPPRLSRP